MPKPAKKKGELIPVQRAALPAPVGPPKPAAAALAGFISENTKRAYRRDLKDFFKVEDLETVPLERILSVQPEDVVAFRDKLMAEKMMPSTVGRKLAAIRCMYNHLIARRAVQMNPADPKLVRAPKKPTILHTDWITWKEAKALLQAPDRDTEIGKRDYAALLVAANAGLRRSELCHLRDEDIREGADQWAVHLRGKGEKERFIPIRKDVVNAVEDWKRVRPRSADWLFTTMTGARFTEHDFWKAVRKYAIKTGIMQADGKSGKKIHPHSLRAAFIFFLEQAGRPVSQIQQLAGHARGETTLGYIRQIDLLKSGADKALEGLDGEEE